jgi:hypothetical protein
MNPKIGEGAAEAPAENGFFADLRRELLSLITRLLSEGMARKSMAW